jgi:N-acyl-D-aspartate/D-glutamate deacylase
VHDIVIHEALIVDGTGASPAYGDVGVDGGRITALGQVGPARRTIEADGRVVAPGFVDVHTHLDVQGFWDQTLSPSPAHGVTTIFGGNCGFSVAPLTGEAADYLMRMLARVEGMPLESLQQGVPWDWQTTAEFLDRLDGTLALNAGFMVGHSALRRVAMGEAANEREATADELLAMQNLLRDGLRAGALGFSSTWSETHNDSDGIPVPSRFAAPDELVALAGVCREFEGTSLEFLPGIGRFTERQAGTMVEMSLAAQRPLNWNALTVTAHNVEESSEKLALGDRARAAGAKIIGLVLPEAPPARFCFRSGFVLDAIPGWLAPMALPLADKLRLLSDPAERSRLNQLAQQPGPMRSLGNWGAKRIVETFTDATKCYQGRIVAEIASELGKDPFDALLDIALADELRMSFCNANPHDTDADWAARARIWTDPRAVVGASDAGAHLDMLATFSYTTTLLQKGVREHGLLALEDAVRLLTDVPARLYGLRERGRVAQGFVADLVVFDPDTVGVTEVVTRFDLPGGAGRLYAGATGIDHVLVNGEPIISNEELTDARPGTLLRSGRDTATPSLV